MWDFCDIRDVLRKKRLYVGIFPTWSDPPWKFRSQENQKRLLKKNRSSWNKSMVKLRREFETREKFNTVSGTDSPLYPACQGYSAVRRTILCLPPLQEFHSNKRPNQCGSMFENGKVVRSSSNGQRWKIEDQRIWPLLLAPPILPLFEPAYF